MSTTRRKFDVFLCFRGPDTHNFISSLYGELERCNIRTFRDKIVSRALEESRFAVVVVSVNFTASRWCLDELDRIMDLEKLGSIRVIPVFYGVDPSQVRRQIIEVAEHYSDEPEKVLSWSQALTNLTNISGYSSYHWEDDSSMIDEITDEISKKLLIPKPKLSGSKLQGIDTHMEALYQLLDLNSNKNVKVIGIWARGSICRSALAKFVYEDISQHFECHSFLESGKRISQDRHKEFLESVKKISQDRHMSHLHKEFLIWIQGQSLSKSRFKNQKVLFVANVNNLEQFDALAEDFNNFGPGSRVIITTQDKKLLKSANIKLVYEVEFLRFQSS